MSAAEQPLVGILVGSESDRERMQAAMDELDARGIAWEFDVRSAHASSAASSTSSQSWSFRSSDQTFAMAGRE